MILRFLLIFIPIVIAAAGQIILKLGMNKIGVVDFAKTGLVNFFLKIFNTPLVLLGLFFYAFSAILWLVVLSREKLSFVYPLVAFSYVITVVLSVVILKEEVPWLHWLGLGVICLGIILIAKSSS